MLIANWNQRQEDVKVSAAEVDEAREGRASELLLVPCFSWAPWEV